MPALRSFAKYYWAALFIALALYCLSVVFYSPAAGLAWFAVVAGIGSVYVFHFEFGRFMGFLKAHCPTQHAELQRTRFLEMLAFVHPSLIRKLWRPHASPTEPQESAFLVYRAAWLFTLVSLLVLLVLANTVQ